MNIVKRIEQYNNENVYFCEPIKNNIMTEGIFIRILYSNELFVLNGISLLVTLNDVNLEKYYNKYKCTFNITNHLELIENLRQIESNLLKNYDNNKIPQYKIYEQLKNGNIKLFLENIDPIQISLPTAEFILKISGVWETTSHYGLTYKFLKANNM